jgi:seryl-tRNA synthetase
MIDLKYIRENRELVELAIAEKNDHADIKLLLEKDVQRREIIKDVEQLKHQRNVASEEIGRLKREKQDAAEMTGQMREISGKIKDMDRELTELDEVMRSILLAVPNIPHSSVPKGTSSNQNIAVREWGQEKTFDFTACDHLEIGEYLDIIDFKRGTKVSGSGFPFYKGAGALMERSLINFMLDIHTRQHGYTEIFPPFLVNRNAAIGTGQLPKSEEQMYHCSKDDLFCIPTAEVPVTNIYRDEVLPKEKLPLYHTAYSACFRREAGSWGKDTRGFLRLHQFNKVEMVKFVQPETSYDELEKLVNNAEDILKALNLKYRVLALCKGDLSFAAAKCYDLEVWAPVEKKWLEVSSCSNFEDFQARRANIRFRDKEGKVSFVHTLNGSGLATSRIIVALLETYQTRNKTLLVPEVLQSYMHGLTEIMPHRIV